MVAGHLYNRHHGGGTLADVLSYRRALEKEGLQRNTVVPTIEKRAELVIPKDSPQNQDVKYMEYHDFVGPEPYKTNATKAADEYGIDIDDRVYERTTGLDPTRIRRKDTVNDYKALRPNNLGYDDHKNLIAQRAARSDGAYLKNDAQQERVTDPRFSEGAEILRLNTKSFEDLKPYDERSKPLVSQKYNNDRAAVLDGVIYDPAGGREAFTAGANESSTNNNVFENRNFVARGRLEPGSVPERPASNLPDHIDPRGAAFDKTIKDHKDLRNIQSGNTFDHDMRDNVGWDANPTKKCIDGIRLTGVSLPIGHGATRIHATEFPGLEYGNKSYDHIFSQANSRMRVTETNDMGGVMRNSEPGAYVKKAEDQPLTWNNVGGHRRGLESAHAEGMATRDQTFIQDTSLRDIHPVTIDKGLFGGYMQHIAGTMYNWYQEFTSKKNLNEDDARKYIQRQNGMGVQSGQHQIKGGKSWVPETYVEKEYGKQHDHAVRGDGVQVKGVSKTARNTCVKERNGYDYLAKDPETPLKLPTFSPKFGPEEFHTHTKYDRRGEIHNIIPASRQKNGFAYVQ